MSHVVPRTFQQSLSLGYCSSDVMDAAAFIDEVQRVIEDSESHIRVTSWGARVIERHTESVSLNSLSNKVLEVILNKSTYSHHAVESGQPLDTVLLHLRNFYQKTDTQIKAAHVLIRFLSRIREWHVNPCTEAPRRLIESMANTGMGHHLAWV